jgi:predicted Mrr-cat superfamily restriction endonuclease
MKIWLHRISHHAEVAYPLLDNGYLSIGYSDFSKPDFIKDCCGKNGWQSFEKYFDDIWRKRPKTRYNLWRFVAEMGEGDLVTEIKLRKKRMDYFIEQQANRTN